MFDFGIGSFELMMLAIVAIIVVGPKDLPKLLRTIGQFTTKIRGLAREFQGYLDEAARDTGLDDVKNEVSKVTNFDVNDALNSATDINKSPTESSDDKPDVDPIEEANKKAKETAAAVRAADAKAAKKATKKTAKKTVAKKAKKKAVKKAAAAKA